MDIDEFLDREFSELGLTTDKTEEPVQMPQFKEEFEPSSLLENIKVNLSKGKLEEAEQSYSQLWNTLLQQRLKWNKELYEQLSILSKQFSSILNQAYSEVKKKANHIYELMGRARAALNEGKKEVPFKIYSEMQEIINSIPNVFFEEKRVVQDQIADFYKELRNTTNNELIKRVSALSQEINQLIDKTNALIRLNDATNAIVNYNRCIELYNQVPEGFLRYKNSAGIRLLEIYKNLSIYMEISSLQKYLGSLLPQQTAPATFTRQRMPMRTNIIKKPIIWEKKKGIEVPTKLATTAPDKKEELLEKKEELQQKLLGVKKELLSEKKKRAQKNIEKGFYNEASKSIEEVLQLDPNDVEAKAIRAKIKTLQ